MQIISHLDNVMVSDTLCTLTRLITLRGDFGGLQKSLGFLMAWELKSKGLNLGLILTLDVEIIKSE